MKRKAIYTVAVISFLVILVLTATKVAVKTDIGEEKTQQAVTDENMDITQSREIKNDFDELPSWIVWEEKEINKSGEEIRIILKDKKVTVFCKNEEIWESPEDIYVQDIMLCEVDGVKEHPERSKYSSKRLAYEAPAEDEELLLVCWKNGKYGGKRPFWVEEDEKELSQHLFVYNVWKGKVMSRWMSSYIGQDIYKMENENETIILEDCDGVRRKWVWNNWGFEVKEDK